MGPSGPAGEQGPAGTSIQSTEIVGSELFITFDNGAVQSAGTIEIPGGAIILEDSQYNFSFNDLFGQIELEITDPFILSSYIRLGISVRVYENTSGSNAYLNTFTSLYAGDPNNMAGLLSLLPGTYNAEISFFTDLGLIIINETFIVP